MLQEMRLALTLHRPPGHAAPAPTAAQILRAATEGGAATTPYAGSIGALAPGLRADLVLLDWGRVTRPWQDPAIPLVDVLVRRARAEAVETVIIAGEVVYHRGRFTRVDRDAVLTDIARAMDRADTPTEAGLRRLGHDLLPHVERYYDSWLG
jgi:5-methylthioadenosine/S-adenosylhomocysteine deaminase